MPNLAEAVLLLIAVLAVFSAGHVRYLGDRLGRLLPPENKGPSQGDESSAS